MRLALGLGASAMPTAAETYLAWERESPATIVHVMIIEPIGGVAADRLTLTDKPYYDKGVSGVKYHQTYPAPIQCIISDIVTDEQIGSTSFSDIVVIDVGGRLGALQTDTTLIGAPFRMLRGDRRWSLMETDYPSRFIEIYRGMVNSVRISRSGKQVAIRVDHASVSLDRKIGSPDSPVSFGSVFNVPAVLVDSATDRYRFDTRKLSPPSIYNFYVRDGGADLAVTTDYTTVTETNDFKGLIELVGGAPSKDLTATIRRDWSSLQVVCSGILRDYVFTDGPAPTGDESPFITAAYFAFNSDESLIFLANNADVKSYVLSTPGTLASMPGTSAGYSTTVTISAHMTGPIDIRFSANGGKMYLLNASDVVHQWNLSTAWDLSTATHDSSIDITTLLTIGSDDVYSFLVTPDGATMVICMGSGTVYTADLTGGDVDTATNAQVVLYVKSSGWGENDDCGYFDISPDGAKAYFHRFLSKRIYQYTLPTAWSFEGAFYSGRSIFQLIEDGSALNVTEGNPVFRISESGDKYYVYPVKTSGTKLYAFDGIADFDLPYETFDCNRPQGFFYNPFNFEAGIHLNSETEAGAALTELIASADAQYCVSRFGGLYAQLKVFPGSFPDALGPDVPVFAISTGDFIGTRDQCIRHVDTEIELKRILARYKKNYRPQGRAELVTSITEDLRESYGRPYTLSATDLANIRGDEMLLETLFYDSVDVGFFVAVYEERGQYYIHTIQLRLSAVTQLSEFGIGSIISIDSNLDDGFATAGKAQVIGRSINWSKNMQTLTILSN